MGSLVWSKIFKYSTAPSVFTKNLALTIYALKLNPSFEFKIHIETRSKFQRCMLPDINFATPIAIVVTRHLDILADLLKVAQDPRQRPNVGHPQHPDIVVHRDGHDETLTLGQFRLLLASRILPDGQAGVPMEQGIFEFLEKFVVVKPDGDRIPRLLHCVIT